MAQKFGQRAYFGKDLTAILQDAHLDARSDKPNSVGKISTKIDSLGTSEDSSGNIVIVAQVSFYEDA